MKSWTKEQFIEAINTSKKIIEVAKKLGLTNLGSNYKTIKKYIKTYNLDISHFLSKSEQLQEARAKQKHLTNEELFCINSIDRKHIKNKIIQENLIDYCCQLCDITEWQGEELSLHLDHINGINNDNRLENLRFLCPNCHSLTPTYCGKNKKLNIKDINNCITYGKIIGTHSIYCNKCVKRNKIIWPEDNVLLEMVKNSNYTQVGKLLQVSANAVKKRLHSKVYLSLSTGRS